MNRLLRTGMALPRRPLVEAWRSPYFDWSALPEEGATEPIGIVPHDADALDAAARWGRVIGGLAQWEEALDALCALDAEADLEDDLSLPADVPTGPAAGALQARFHRFLCRIAPPQGQRSYREFVAWLEALIGPDPELAAGRASAPPEEPTALQVVACARAAADPTVAERDVAALQALKDVLRGLVWAEEALGTAAVDFARFVEELAGAVQATTYRLPVHPDREEVLVADVVQARGLSFRAVAVLGLAEGEFPALLGEDPFLRDADRQRLAQQFDMPLRPSTESAEAGFFYEAIARPRERLLLTRPRLADNGAPWQASPFWEEVRRRVRAEPARLTSESVPAPDRAASWPELMESLAAHPADGLVPAWARRAGAGRQAALDAAVHLLCTRRNRAPGAVPPGTPAGAFDGDLGEVAVALGRHFGPGHVWSASRLEGYRTCPLFFFVGSVLRLQPREEPAEGLNARQLGNIYHRILEGVYQAPGVEDPGNLAQLLDALPGVAGAVLDEAPQREGFRETAWWAQTRREIVEHVRASLQALAKAGEAFRPCRYEAAFGLRGRPPLIVRDGEDRFCLRGFIDRVDRAPDGRLRVIDYKTGGPSAYTRRAVAEGKKLQLPLYALAARDALGLGQPVEGFYWHVQHAQASGFTLGDFEGGAEGAMAAAVEKAWEAVRGAREGCFVPCPPADGCPSYCPAAAFCWHCRPGFRR